MINVNGGILMKSGLKSIKMSLKLKLSIMFFIFISVPLIFLGITSYNMASSSMQTSTEQQLRDLTENTAKSINQTMDSVKSDVQIMSVNKNLARIAATGDNTIRSEVFQYLSELKSEHSNEIESLIVTDASGKSVVSDEKEIDDVNYSDREYVQEALKGNMAQSDVIISKITGNPVVAIAYPLMLNSKISGLLIATIKFENISTHAAEVKVGKNGYAYMIDKNGMFLYHPVKTKILKDNIGNIDNAQLKALVSEMKEGKTSQGYYTYEGVRKYVRFTPVNNWILVVTADYNEYMAAAINIRRSTIIIALSAILVAMLLAYLFTTRNIIKPIKKLESLMSKAGNGDLTVKASINSGDEIEILGTCFNQMINHQSGIITNVRAGARELAASSEEISACAEEISAATEEITASIQEVAANSEKQNNSIVETSEVLLQLSSLVQIAQNKANTAKKNSDNTMGVAKLGRLKVQETVDAIDNINKVSDDTASTLQVLNELSSKVSGIVGTINNISNQTSLLALNASIEAARAGENGKGFTVVANEVRQLSEQTSVESSQISSLVNEMVVQINKAVSSMIANKQVVESGVTIVSETDKSFISIIEAVEQIAKDIEQIVGITKDEVASSDQIVKLIDSVATITELTTANTEEVASSAEEQAATVETLATAAEQTSAMAVSLDNLVEKFVI